MINNFIRCCKQLIYYQSKNLKLESISTGFSEKMNFYRRPLPETCVSFSSQNGKKLFTESLLSGYMENYFRLASQFRTQDEPAFCGLATLVMTLNAMEVDPGRIWKGPWRWYHEEMLDCCIPVSKVKDVGITLDQFICISRCNGLKANAYRLSQDIKFEDFQQIVIEVTQNDGEILIVSYSRKGLGQTGDGHFAPVGGYHPKEEMVLLFDTARFKYPPHWVPIKMLWESMKLVDKVTGCSRGFVKLSRDVDSSCQLLLDMSTDMTEYLLGSNEKFVNNMKMQLFGSIMNEWLSWLRRAPSDVNENAAINDREVCKETVKQLLAIYIHSSANFNQIVPAFFLTYRNHFSKDINKDLEATLSIIVKEVIESEIGVLVNEEVSLLTPQQIDSFISLEVFKRPEIYGCNLLLLKDPRVHINFLISCWMMACGLGYPKIVETLNLSAHNETYGMQLYSYCSKILANSFHNDQTRVELTQLCKKLIKMQCCKNSIDCCKVNLGCSGENLSCQN